jgi:hypothetical protein
MAASIGCKILKRIATKIDLPAALYLAPNIEFRWSSD